MSNTEGDLERSSRRHRPAIIGILVAVLLAALAFFFFGARVAPDDEVAPVTDTQTTTPADGAAATPAAPATDAPAPSN